jgi:hypothetical protein
MGPLAAGVHRSMIGGIHGSEQGAYSICLSGGYPEDEDHGDYFIYTGSGGRELAEGNKRQAKQTLDQKLERFNLGLALTCNRAARKSDTQGFTAPDWKKSQALRVLRGFKEKSIFAPKEGYRYDGIYKIEKYWPRKNSQNLIVWVCGFDIF